MCFFFRKKKAKYGEIISDLELEIMKRSNSNSAASNVQGTGTACFASKTGACFGGQGNQCTESVQSLSD